MLYQGLPGIVRQLAVPCYISDSSGVVRFLFIFCPMLYKGFAGYRQVIGCPLLYQRFLRCRQIYIYILSFVILAFPRVSLDFCLYSVPCYTRVSSGVLSWFRSRFITCCLYYPLPFYASVSVESPTSFLWGREMRNRSTHRHIIINNSYKFTALYLITKNTQTNNNTLTYISANKNLIIVAEINTYPYVK